MHVVIVGAGVGGLCLAQGLRKAGISCSVYEQSPEVPRSGLLLQMNADGGNGLRACLPAQLHELYVRTSRVTPQRNRVLFLDHRGRKTATRALKGPASAPGTSQTAVHRRTLCQIMLSGIEDQVHFGRRAIGYRPAPDGGIVVTFTGGPEARGDLLVGADGINSVVRRQLLPHAEVSVLVENVLMAKADWTPHVRSLLPEAGRYRSVVITDPHGTSLTAALFEPRRNLGTAAAELVPGLLLDRVDDYVSVSVEPAFGNWKPSGAGLPVMSKIELHELMRQAVAEWSPHLRRLVSRLVTESIYTTSSRVVRPLAPWPTSSVTLLGDAAHATPPRVGDSVNYALRDAEVLTEALAGAAAGSVDLATAVAGYEEKLRRVGGAVVGPAIGWARRVGPGASPTSSGTLSPAT